MKKANRRPIQVVCYGLVLLCDYGRHALLCEYGTNVVVDFLRESVPLIG